MRMWFTEIDTDKSGRIGLDEFKTAFKNQLATPEELEAMFVVCGGCFF